MVSKNGWGLIWGLIFAVLLVFGVCKVEFLGVRRDNRNPIPALENSGKRERDDLIESRVIQHGGTYDAGVIAELFRQSDKQRKNIIPLRRNFLTDFSGAVAPKQFLCGVMLLNNCIRRDVRYSRSDIPIIANSNSESHFRSSIRDIFQEASRKVSTMGDFQLIFQNNGLFLYLGCALAHSLSSAGHLSSLPTDHEQSSNSDSNYRPLRHNCVNEPIAERLGLLGLGTVLLWAGTWLNLKKGGWRWGIFNCLLMLLGVSILCMEWVDRKQPDNQPCSQGFNTVPQKYFLTSLNYWGTVLSIEDMQMANILATEKKVAIVSALAEGSGIRQIERMTGVHRDTIMRLGVKVGQGCAELLDAKMRDLSCGHLQFDELWGFIGKKKRNVTPDDSPEMGDVWTWVAIDAETKLVPTFAVGKRDAETAVRFVSDVASRLANRVQVSTDGLVQYGWAMEMAFKGQVDFAQVVKVYDEQVEDAKVVRVDKTSHVGNPDMDAATTSHVERLNGTTRLHMRRLTRRTYAFSKKLENFEAAVGLHFAYYNFVKRHNTIRCTPAMAAGVERSQWTVAELVEATA
jgi:IS1 family transposase